MFDDNELRNLYRKNGIYKVYVTLKNETHIFAVFQDLEKAILYRDLFESNNWNLNLKGITDLNNPLSSTIIDNTTEHTYNTIDEVELESINKLIEEDNNKTTVDVDEIEAIDGLLNESQNNTLPEEELSTIDNLIAEESSNNEELEDFNSSDNEAENITEINDQDPSDETILDESEIIDDEELDEPDDSFDVKYIHYKNNRYCIEKYLDGKLEFFGAFDTVDEAIQARDYFRDNNWNLDDKDKFKVENENQYIYKINGYFEIRKKIEDKIKSFGRYYNFEDAKTVRNHLKDNDWDKECLLQFKHLQVNERKKNPKRYIRKDDNGRYKIIKTVNDKQVLFGIYGDFEDAKTARDYFEEHGWNIEDREKFKDKEIKVGKDNPRRYICQTNNNYSINKNGTYFGVFNTLEEAMEARDWLEEHDFSLEYKDKFKKEKKENKVSKSYFESMELF